ncbi:MAG: S8 family serine peptidase [bacterium]|nr:S8 family serine peptidase [bacterium]MDD5353597.1 S8 family serine peptidase [bacterium]MDD5755867.1 S8 family serine peptidase [bacterium]
MSGLKRGLIGIAILMGLVNSPTFSIAADQAVNEPPRKAGEILVKLRASGSSHRQNVSSSIDSISATMLKEMQPVFSAAPQSSGSSQKQLSPQNSPLDEGLSRWFTVSVKDGQDLQDTLDACTGSSLVEYAEPIYIYSIAAVPNDPYYSSSGTWGQQYDDQWGLKNIQSERAWNISRGNSDAIVAVIDTGVDSTHPDLSANIWSNPGEIPGNGIDDDNNGYIDDTMGWDFIDNNNDPMDTHGHGTHLSGIIAAVGNNGQGITGVCWQAKIMVIKGLTDSGTGASDQLAQAIKYAVDNGAKVINLSWGGYGTSLLIQDALMYAYDHNCVIVAAAGNNNTNAEKFFPGNYSQAITVAACNANDVRASFSNYGPNVDVTAPGVDILSLKAKGTDMCRTEVNIVGGEYYRASGTSMATPFVSGLAALIIASDRSLTNLEIEAKIIASCEDLGSSGKDDYYGYGRINAAQAMVLGKGEQVRVTDFNVIDTPSDDGDSLDVTWTASSVMTVEGFSIYYATAPFAGISDDGVQFATDSPVNDPQAKNCTISGLQEGTGYYIAVVATLDSDNKAYVTSTSNTNLLSASKPVYPVHNIIRSNTSADAISWDQDWQTRAVIPQNPENNNKILNITIPQQGKTSLVSAADTKLYQAMKLASEEELDASIVEFKTSDVISGPLTIHLSYPSAISGWQESNLRIYQLNERSANWEEVPGSQLVLRNNHTVAIEIAGSELAAGRVYRLFSPAGALENLDEVKVYPNPYKPNSGLGHTQITFTNIMNESIVKIYTLTGELVRTLRDDLARGELSWDATNETGQKVASGLYIFLVESNNSKHKTGKLAIIK